MKLSSGLAALSLLLHSTSAGKIRFGCSQLAYGVFDPLIFPGQTTAGHLHQFNGGNGLNYTLDQADVAPESSCTTCTFAENFSNYWTATLFFKARNGTYHQVQQIPNSGFEEGTGGVTVYYAYPDDGRSVTSFPPGFRMLVGNPAARSSSERAKSGTLTYSCLTSLTSRPIGKSSMPAEPCAGGIMANIRFPQCWNGEDLDSEDHRSHVASASAKVESGGACPDGFPVLLPEIYMEVVWDTTPFNDPSIWPTDGSQPFVWSQGDLTGYGAHADYIFGWQGDKLQQAMDDKCENMKCDALKTQGIADGKACANTLSPAPALQLDGWLETLPNNIVVN
ncbi:hypothetical protein Daus18300_010698 [Diaporthe australafricana]|uniref:DUF1996 domain-containing protein n=1 Tax=Diaporthe australafricana TaxID=127596 RepID=A0ABR3W9C8_9PEZI